MNVDFAVELRLIRPRRSRAQEAQAVTFGPLDRLLDAALGLGVDVAFGMEREE